MKTFPFPKNKISVLSSDRKCEIGTLLTILISCLVTAILQEAVSFTAPITQKYWFWHAFSFFMPDCFPI